VRFGGTRSCTSIVVSTANPSSVSPPSTDTGFVVTCSKTGVSGSVGSNVSSTPCHQLIACWMAFGSGRELWPDSLVFTYVPARNPR